MNSLHNCRHRTITAEVNGKQIIRYEATCMNASCAFREKYESIPLRTQGVRNHRKFKLTQERFRIFYKYYRGDLDRVKEAMDNHAEIATHEYNEWVDIVNRLMRSALGVDLASVDPFILRRSYGEGRDAQETVSIILTRAYELVK